MKVLLVCTNADEAGAPRHVYSLVQGLCSAVEFLVVFGEDGPNAKRIRDLGVKVVVVSDLNSKMSLLNDYKCFIRLARIAKDFKPEILHCHSSKAGMIGRFVALRYDFKVVYTVHGWGWRGLGIFSKVMVYFVELFLSKVNVRSLSYIYVSKSVEDSARKLLKIRPRQGRVVYNGVNDQMQPHSNRDRGGKQVIIMPARVCGAKNHKALVGAFNAVNVDSELWLCGSGTDAKDFAGKIQKWAPDRFLDVKLLGERSDVVNLIASANVFALISNYEALPLSIIEAMSLGKLVVATPVGGIPELISHGYNGYLSSADQYELSAVINESLCLDRQEKMGRASRLSYLRCFTIDKMNNAVLEVYHDAVSG